MLCPVCQVEFAKSEREGIEIDYCLNCHGVWLDRGELNKIIDRADDDDDFDDDDYEKAKHDDPYEKVKNDQQPEKRKRGTRPKKRKSVLHDIFDIFD